MPHVLTNKKFVVSQNRFYVFVSNRCSLVTKFKNYPRIIPDVTKCQKEGADNYK